ncbi:HD domain-containing protein [Candidatus Palauibacter sp.]|uniref:Ppx/GppA phosphatase family protein n=1 Tax=Candidatus Palauibacter sp. TaxID=3101350 RepID=UPI003B5265BF
MHHARQSVGGAALDSPTRLGFPLRVAAIDVGSNAFRFIAAEFHAPDRYVELSGERVPVRLGHSAFLTGELSAAAIEKTVEGFCRFRREIDRLGIDHVRAVATSAVRESRNGADLVRRVEDEAGITIRLISGTEEARLVWTAARSRIDFGDAKWMLVDLGGGSVEVSLADRSGIMWSESHRMGSVRLLNELTGADDAPAHFAKLLAEYAASLRIPHASKHWTPVELIATGGNIEALARLAGRSRSDGVPEITRVQLGAAIEEFSRLSYSQRIGRLGLREDRADVILPAAIVYDRVAELAGADRILVPGVGVKEGTLLDLVDELTSGAGLGRLERIVHEGALTLGRRYLFDEDHGRHVASLAVSLFDQLADLHRLDPPDRSILLAGALLHDIGQHISYARHHKHSLYLILHSEIPGIAPDELPLVALVARYHRRAEPREGHYLYRDMTAADRARVEKLAALLRIADSLDREHLQRVHSVEARLHEDRLELRLARNGSVLLEQWALRTKGKLFARIFGLEPYVTFDLERSP